MPHEARVIVTGTRTAKGSGESELFSEETSTALVFADGAVVRLASPANPGQLLFLTNTANKREVIAQVTGKRAFQPGSCYVELQFTEAAAGFWGFEFPAAAAAETAWPAAAPAESLKASESPADISGERQPFAGAGSTQEDEAATAAPSANEVEQLRLEVEKLRSELSSLQNAAPTPSRGRAAAPGSEEAGRNDSARAESGTLSSCGAAPAEATAEEAAAKRRVPRMALPVGSSDAATSSSPGSSGESDFSEQNLLPKPALKFEVPPAKQRAGSGLRAVLLVAVVVGAGAAAYSFRASIPFLNRTPGVTVPRPSGAAAHATRALPTPDGAASDKPIASTTADASVAPQVLPQGRSGNEISAANTKAEAAKSAEPDSDSPAEQNASAGKPSESENDPRREKSSPPARASHSAAEQALRSTHERNAARESSTNVAETTELKLLKSVRAIPPPEAVRQFVTGNVVLDAVVSPEGRVTSAKPLSGPQILRQAAIDTVKRYSYEPATRDGKPVSAHAKVTVQFWYEP